MNLRARQALLASCMYIPVLYGMGVRRDMVCMSVCVCMCHCVSVCGRRSRHHVPVRAGCAAGPGLGAALSQPGGSARQHLRHRAAGALLLPTPLLPARGALLGAPGAVRRGRCGPAGAPVGLSGAVCPARPGHRLRGAVAVSSARPGLSDRRPRGGPAAGSARRSAGPGHSRLGGGAYHARLLAAVSRTLTWDFE